MAGRRTELYRRVNAERTEGEPGFVEGTECDYPNREQKRQLVRDARKAARRAVR